MTGVARNCPVAPAFWVTLNRHLQSSTIDLVEQRSEEWDKDLTLVRVAGRELKISQVTLQRQVDIARQNGHSWAAIGLVLDLSERVAQERFARPGDQST